MIKLYLDTSTLLKCFIYESETETSDVIFDKAVTGELTIVTSQWNIEEALGVLDEKRRRGWLTETSFWVAIFTKLTHSK